jgi:hypothetical protein
MRPRLVFLFLRRFTRMVSNFLFSAVVFFLLGFHSVALVHMGVFFEFVSVPVDRRNYGRNNPYLILGRDMDEHLV